MDRPKSHNLELDPLLSEPAEITNTSVNQTKPSDSRSYTRESRRNTSEIKWKPSSTLTVNEPKMHSSEHALSQDLNRSTISESFNIGQSDEQDVVDIRIFFPNGKGVQFSVENGQQVPSSTLLDLMADHLKIDSEVASEAFALWLISLLLEVQLKPHHVAYEVHAKWPVFLRKFTTASEEEITLDEPLLMLRRNFQLTVQNELIYLEEYERLTEVLYLDAKDQYLSGRYLVDVGMAVELAALQLAIEFGSYENTRDALDLIQ
ncbi:FERM central domain-containing protein [Ditylenchus destructor]|uniref:FERM domain-containing protein 8 n=1 Tax=Ditylenchus destructor TaxID=166010 RepID=A0AAD4R544_9BILA|nr:FERM central domain-containing protein [Ditylenchus destructor]